MQKIILDTNVIVSALLTPGIPSNIVAELVLEAQVEVQISDEIFAEYVSVIMRPKFSQYKDFHVNAEIVISKIEEIAFKTNPSQKVEILRDKSDNKFLELAIETRADFLITGNINDFTVESIGRTKIVSPSVYWAKYRPA